MVIIITKATPELPTMNSLVLTTPVASPSWGVGDPVASE
jgi:hypothetical protein